MPSSRAGAAAGDPGGPAAPSVDAVDPVVDTVVFDLGNVLIDWDPRHLYRTLIPDPVAMERFLAEVCSMAWHGQQDAGRSLAAGTAALLAARGDVGPEADLIRAFYDRWDEMLRGPIAGTVAILEELHAAGVPLYALTNWPAETFPRARTRFGFLARFRGIVVSGDEGVKKPDPAIYRTLFARHRVDPARAAYVDDVPANAAAATALGMRGLVFVDPPTLRADLVALGVLPAAPAGSGGLG